MTNVTRPMLAETLHNLDELSYPVLASPKLDGIRCLMVAGAALTRKFKPIPNIFIRNWLETNFPSGLDGELIIKGKNFNEIQSAIMSEGGEPDFEFWAFDLVTTCLKQPFSERYSKLITVVATSTFGRLKLVPHVLVHDKEQLLKLEQTYLEMGYEGVMLRSINGEYKCGRSTLNQGWLLKFKRFSDSEAVILGFEELMTNTNEKTVNNVGLSKRSGHQAGKIPAGILGKFRVRDISTGVEFEIGAGEGLTKELRKEIWDNKEKHLGKLVKYKFQTMGMKSRPRFPVWLGFRDERDM